MVVCGVDGVLMRFVGAYGVGLWKNFKKGWGEFSSHTKFEVGDGFRIKFWYDVWCGDQALKETFIVLFYLARCKDASMVDHLEFSSVTHQ